jgi:hypothetical protein
VAVTTEAAFVAVHAVGEVGADDRAGGCGQVDDPNRPSVALNPAMRGQPVRERLGVAAFEQVERRSGLAVDDDRAVVLAAPDREVVHPEDPRGRRRRVRGGHEQPQQDRPTGQHAQAGGEPGARPAG